jgi:hypothetical protein
MTPLAVRRTALGHGDAFGVAKVSGKGEVLLNRTLVHAAPWVTCSGWWVRIPGRRVTPFLACGAFTLQPFVVKLVFRRSPQLPAGRECGSARRGNSQAWRRRTRSSRGCTKRRERTQHTAAISVWATGSALLSNSRVHSKGARELLSHRSVVFTGRKPCFGPPVFQGTADARLGDRLLLR